MAIAAWQSAWAKSLREDDGGCVTHWLPLFQHLDDSAAVAGRLVDSWLPTQVVRRISRDLPDGLDGVRTLACWLASVHDVGKLAPAFSVQVPALADRMRANGLVASPSLAQDPYRSRVTHALVGHFAVTDWLVDELGFSPPRHHATQLAGVVGSHHGVPPESSQLALVRDRPDLAGAGPWQQARTALLDRAATAIGGRNRLAHYRGVRLSRPSQVLLTAVVIVADRIASNAELFPLEPISTASDPLAELDENAQARRTAAPLEAGWALLGLPPRWIAQHLSEDLDQVFRDRFNPEARGARPVQVAAVAAATAQATPGMIIVEAPMGTGKTEAALLAAEEFAAKSGADGCFLALPTQPTSDAMFARVTRWLEVLPGRDPSEQVSVYLAHGKAVLNDRFSGLVRAGRFGSIGDDSSAALVAHRWLSGRKKRVLASFVVGTVDQVLFAGLKSRHLMLRHLALAGKVVIIDEVHAYDVYMSQYLHRVLHWLGAYDSGTGCTTTVEPDPDPGYPVVLSSGGRPAQPVAVSGEKTSVHFDHLPDDLDTLVAYLRTHLADGGCAVVVRNTVGRVQDTARRLMEEFGEENVTVNHARFLSCDRAHTDQGLLRRFGPPGPATQRPPLHIVVGSQVIEQSLDVDFDLLITDLAPVDLVLQRLGRLHRHQRSRPTPLSSPRCALVGVENWSEAPPRAVPSSRRVYGEHLLLRSAALLAREVRAEIVLPDDISPLVQADYGPAELRPPRAGVVRSTWRCPS